MVRAEKATKRDSNMQSTVVTASNFKLRNRSNYLSV